MGKLTCKCLNVQISAKSTDLNPVDTASLGLSPACAEEFFSSQISEVHLSLEGVKFEHQCLVKTRQVGEWTVHKCMSCGQATHASHTVKGSGKVLVNMELFREPTSIESLTKSPDFSPLYRIVLPHRNDNHPVRSLGVQSGKYESLQKLLGSIQQQLNSFLVEEESTMEDRIKKYMESQRSAYAELQSKVRRDKNTMVNLVLASEQQEITESLSDAMTESPTSPLSPARETSSEEMTGSEAELVPFQVPTQSKRPLAFNRGSDDVPTTKTKKMPSLSERLKMGNNFSSSEVQENRVTSSLDPDGDLDFDAAFHDEDTHPDPFYSSDDETEDTDDSEPDWRTVQASRNLYSTSVPISVPMWGRAAKKSYVEEEEEGDDHPLDGASMAASIKALAQSVHGDGTEMFGELPRPRRNTSNFGHV